MVPRGVDEMKKGTIPNFDSIADVFDNYKKISSKIQFEGRVYKYMNVNFKGDIKKYIYRNEEERHNLVITGRDNEVLSVVGIYSVGELTI